MLCGVPEKMLKIGRVNQAKKIFHNFVLNFKPALCTKLWDYNPFSGIRT